MSNNINIGDFVRDIANSSATDLAAQTSLQGRLHEIKAAIPAANHPELGFMLEAAADLMRYLAEGQSPTAQAMLTMATRLLVNAECSMYRNLEVMASSEVGTNVNPKTATRGELRLNTDAVVEEEPSDLRDMRLGQFLVQLGLVDSRQVAEAMEIQERDKLLLGEALLKLGSVDQTELRNALGLREKMQQFAEVQTPGEYGGPSPKIEVDEWQESLLGAILVANQSLTEEQLKKGLGIHKATGMRLGEALVQHRFCDWPAVRSAIKIQEQLRHISKNMKSVPLPALKPLSPLPKIGG